MALMPTQLSSFCEQHAFKTHIDGTLSKLPEVLRNVQNQYATQEFSQPRPSDLDVARSFLEQNLGSCFVGEMDLSGFPNIAYRACWEVSKSIKAQAGLGELWTGPCGVTAGGVWEAAL